MTRDGPPVDIAAPAVTAVDATGAGDALNGALAAGLAGGLGLEAGVASRGRGASLSVTRAGAREGYPGREELEAALDAESALAAAETRLLRGRGRHRHRGHHIAQSSFGGPRRSDRASGDIPSALAASTHQAARPRRRASSPMPRRRAMNSALLQTSAQAGSACDADREQPGPRRAPGGRDRRGGGRRVPSAASQSRTRTDDVASAPAPRATTTTGSAAATPRRPGPRSRPGIRPRAAARRRRGRHPRRAAGRRRPGGTQCADRAPSGARGPCRSRPCRAGTGGTATVRAAGGRPGGRDRAGRGRSPRHARRDARGREDPRIEPAAGQAPGTIHCRRPRRGAGATRDSPATTREPVQPWSAPSRRGSGTGRRRRQRARRSTSAQAAPRRRPGGPDREPDGRPERTSGEAVMRGLVRPSTAMHAAGTDPADHPPDAPERPEVRGGREAWTRQPDRHRRTDTGGRWIRAGRPQRCPRRQRRARRARQAAPRRRRRTACPLVGRVRS